MFRNSLVLYWSPIINSSSFYSKTFLWSSATNPSWCPLNGPYPSQVCWPWARPPFHIARGTPWNIITHWFICYGTRLRGFQSKHEGQTGEVQTSNWMVVILLMGQRYPPQESKDPWCQVFVSFINVALFSWPWKQITKAVLLQQCQHGISLCFPP